MKDKLKLILSCHAVRLDHDLSEHLYLIDPNGNWMMRFPPGLNMEQAASLKRDWDRLLRASVSWDKPGR